MFHQSISLTNLGLFFSHKTCFSGFSTCIPFGARIAVIGQNGCGKSTLLKILQGLVVPSEGAVHVPPDVSFGYVPQILGDFGGLSGGQGLNAALTQALALNPNVLLLDEPTNHLDSRNRRSLLRLIQKFPGTVLVVSHDPELLSTCVDTLWHIEDGKVTVFSGHYEAYVQDIAQKRAALEKDLKGLAQEKKQIHKDLMKEQERAKKSRVRGQKKRQQGHWPTLVAGAKKRQAEETTGHYKERIGSQKQHILDELANLRLPETIVPKFSLSAANLSKTKTVLSIQEGACGYGSPLLEGIFLSLSACGRLAVTGKNASGKTTLVKAILNDPSVVKSGTWVVPHPQNIGYLDQRYATLDPSRSVLETIRLSRPDWSLEEARRHLNDFLFRKEGAVQALTSLLSGGEKVRLSLAQIAAKTPELLILDEVTNNLDLETRNHVIQTLKAYPGAIVVISHDEDFLEQIGVESFYECQPRESYK